jgi:hypothetical protein
MGKGGSSPMGKWQVCDVDYLPPSTAKITNEWGYKKFSSPVCHHGVGRDNFTITFVLSIKIQQLSKH